MTKPDLKMKQIVIGVRLDPFFEPKGASAYSHSDESRAIVGASKSLALKTKSSLRLISVVEDKAIDLTAAAPWLPTFNWQNLRMDTIVHAARKEAMNNTKRQLDVIANEIGDGFDVTTNVVTAKTADLGILADAVSVDASLIVLGSGTKADQYFTRGFSTPLAVMAESTKPVLVIGTNCKVDFSKERYRILVADDLREQTARAMSAAVQWAESLGGSDVLHLHIEELSPEELRRVLGQTVPELRSNADSEKLTSDLMHSLEVAFQERVKERVQGAEEGLKQSGGTFRFELKRCPFIREEIERAADDFRADILVFGRHHTTHHRPFLVGRVTYQSMLSQKRGVLLIP